MGTLPRGDREKGDEELQPRPSSVGQGAGWASWRARSAGQGVSGQARVPVLGPGSARPDCVNLDSAFSFLSLKVLPTPTPSSRELHYHHEGVRAVRGVQVTPTCSPQFCSSTQMAGQSRRETDTPWTPSPLRHWHATIQWEPKSASLRIQPCKVPTAFALEEGSIQRVWQTEST